MNELNKIIDEALSSGIRINSYNEEGFSFTNVAIFKIFYDEFKQSERENIIRKLALNGADFDVQVDEKTTEICDKVQKEVEPQIFDRLKKLKEIGENAAIGGTVTEIEFDNRNFYIGFSQNSRVNVAKVIDGARNLGFNSGCLELDSNIIKLGNCEIKVKTGENGERDYVDISDKSGFMVTFPTTLGELHVSVYRDTKNPHSVHVEVEDKKIWNELQKTGEIVGQDCLFGGISVKEAIEKGNFLRPGSMRPKTTETWVQRCSSEAPSRSI